MKSEWAGLDKIKYCSDGLNWDWMLHLRSAGLSFSRLNFGLDVSSILGAGLYSVHIGWEGLK